MAERAVEISRRAALIADSVVAEAASEDFNSEQMARRLEDYCQIIESDFPDSCNLVRQVFNSYVMGFLRGIIWAANNDIGKRKAKSLINELENLRTNDYSNG